MVDNYGKIYYVKKVLRSDKEEEPIAGRFSTNSDIDQQPKTAIVDTTELIDLGLERRILE